jgi:hypothetical protein
MAKQMGGKRKGAGRKKGTLNPKTIERDEALRQFKQRVMEATAHLQNAQIGLAKGSQYLFKIKTFKGQKSDPILVKDQWEIEAYLRGDFDDEEYKTGNNTVYYFLTTKDPDNRALDSLFNRTYGKALDSLEITNPDGNLKTIIVNKYSNAKK